MYTVSYSLRSLRKMWMSKWWDEFLLRAGIIAGPGCEKHSYERSNFNFKVSLPVRTVFLKY